MSSTSISLVGQASATSIPADDNESPACQALPGAAELHLLSDPKLVEQAPDLSAAPATAAVIQASKASCRVHMAACSWGDACLQIEQGMLAEAASAAPFERDRVSSSVLSRKAVEYLEPMAWFRCQAASASYKTCADYFTFC